MTKACAYIWTSNEEDVITWTIRHLLAEGVDVHVFDNWSTDHTWFILNSFSGFIRFERWPEKEERCSSLTSRLMALEEISRTTDYDWVIHYDADEIRRTGTDETLAQFIERADGAGYNAIDHHIEVYLPKEGWEGQISPEHFFDARVAHVDERSPHIKCWKKTEGLIDLVTCAGHQPLFKDRLVSPEKLILKHYPLRTKEHARRKIEERKESYSPEELQKGWHIQYHTEWWKQ